MSGFTEPSQPLMSVKEEIKEEEFDDFLQEYLSAIPKVEEKPGLELDCKTEIYTSPTLTHKEEEFDDFLQEYWPAIQIVEEKPGPECECKTEMYTSQTMTLKEEKYSPMEIKDEEEFDLSEYGHYVSSPARVSVCK